MWIKTETWTMVVLPHHSWEVRKLTRLDYSQESSCRIFSPCTIIINVDLVHDRIRLHLSLHQHKLHLSHRNWHCPQQRLHSPEQCDTHDTSTTEDNHDLWEDSHNNVMKIWGTGHWFLECWICNFLMVFQINSDSSVTAISMKHFHAGHYTILHHTTRTRPFE